LPAWHITRESATRVDDFSNTIFFLKKSHASGIHQHPAQTLPFWALFTVEHNQKTGILLNFMFFLPQFTQTSQNISVLQLLESLDDAVARLGEKIKKVLLLQEVYAKNILPADLKLAPAP
jgi:hypothetical protein